jgi:oligoendopeptidase F
MDGVRIAIRDEAKGGCGQKAQFVASSLSLAHLTTTVDVRIDYGESLMSTSTLPHWDMTVVYPSLDSPEFAAGFADALRSIDELAELFEQHGIALREPAPLDDAMAIAAEQTLERYNSALKQLYTLAAYIRSFITTNSRDEAAQARWSELQQHLVKLSLLGTRFTAWIGSLDVEELIARSKIARNHAHALRKAKTRSHHLMAPQLEELVTTQNLYSGSAWSKLYSTFTSQLTVPFENNGSVSDLPISAVRNLAFDPNRDVRRRAYEAELVAWDRAAVPIAAALNSIKGEVDMLAQRRAWDSPLDTALFDNNIDRATLDAMLLAARESFPDFRRYLRAKARALGQKALTWYDLFAPIGSSDRTWSFEEAASFITEQFGTFSPKLQALAERAFDEYWIDAEPRAGKVGGAFCMALRRDESRILANYEPSFNSVSTLAHELGHAYHNLNLAEQLPLQRATPMTLAETASIFCETIVVQAALRSAPAQEQLLILEASLQGSCQVVVDITSRFLFEQSVFEHRRQRELSVTEINELMLDAQHQTYGDGLDPDALHPYMWAAKPHYYGSSFYNYPYMFGLLFGLGLYARYQVNPEGFKTIYDQLLSSTGLEGAAELAGRFGIDIRSADFWRASLDVIRQDIERFEELVTSAFLPE